MPRMLFAAALGATMAATAGTAAASAEKTVPPTARTNLAVAIYNGNVAFVREQRRVDLAEGRNLLALSGVSPSMRPSTAAILASGPQPLTLVDQTFAFDLLTPESLLKHSVGRTVRIVTTHPTTGEESVAAAKVLSARNGVVLRIGDRIETELPGRLVFDSLPSSLRESPTLLVTFEAPQQTSASLDLRYLTGGLTWQADYIAELDAKETTLSIQATATIANNSGVAYNDARVRLVAGSIDHGPQPEPPGVRAMSAEETAPMAAAPMPAQPAGDMHIYAIPGATTLSDRATKQITLFGAAKVPVTKEFRIQGDGNVHVRRFGNPFKVNAERLLRFRSAKDSDLAVPMPAGVVRVYARAIESADVFLGADRIAHTAVGEEVRLNLGRAFDITATRRQTDFRKQGLPRNTYETEHEIEIRNATPNGVAVKVVERIPGDWRILSSSAKHEKTASDRAEWTIDIGPNGGKTLVYKARVQL